MKNIAALLFLLILSCKPKTEPTKTQKEILQPNLYDLYYLDMANHSEKVVSINFDSLNLIKDIDNLFDELIKHEILDSTIVYAIKRNRLSNMKNFKIKITDSIKTMVTDSQGNFEIFNSFSEPFMISENECFIFFEKHYKNLGHSDGVVLFSKTPNSKWKLDSIKVLNNYRGGGLSPR